MRITVIIALVFLYACQGTPLKTEAGDIMKDSIAAAKEYYPIPSFIAEELKYAQENPTAITRYITIGNKVDSGFVPYDTLAAFATAFMGIDLNDASFKRDVEEKTFMDESIGLITLNYTINNPKTPLRRADILVKEGEVKSKVSSIYLEKVVENNGAGTVKKLYWKARQNCMIVEQQTDASGNEKVTRTQLVWNAGE
ncbi:MAG: hypothetical protein ACO1NW_05100 [Chitinophagaceae bacterium]